MKQPPGQHNERVIRVQMDKEELHKLLNPILQEVNQLRARVTELEAQSQNCLDDICTLSSDVTRLEAAEQARQDDGK